MKGIILAGGMGTRLRPATLAYNKHMALVYDRPMIYYPIQTLKDMGCTDITLVSGGEHIGGFADLLKDGSEFGVTLTYRVQAKSGGIAEALGCVEPIDGLFTVILGDNYLPKAPAVPTKPTIFVSEVSNPQEYGVYQKGKIVEKPTHPLSNQAVIGLYVYDHRVFDVIKTLKPSARGEYEITDINNWYLKQGAYVMHYSGFWGDMGTPDGLLEVAQYIAREC